MLRLNEDLLASAARQRRKPQAPDPAPEPQPAPVPEPPRIEVQAPVVQVDMRSVGQEIARALQQPTPEAARVLRWDFKIKRDLDGLIESVQATPVYSDRK